MSAKEDAVDYELLKSLGLSMESFGATEGKQAADHFDEIIDKLEDIEFSKATRIEMASMLGNWHSLASDENKTALYTSGKAIRIFEAAKILIPTSDDVKIAEAIVSGSSTYLIMTDFNQTMAPYVVATLRAAMGLSIAASKPLKEDGESQFRANCVSGLLSCLPYTGIRDASKMPEDTVDIIASFISYEPTCQSVQAAGLSALSLLAMNNSDLFNGHLGGIFKALRVYPAASSILGQIQNGFEADPQSYKENLEIFFDMGLQTTFSIIQQISTQDASALAPYVERIRDIALTDQLYGSSAMTWLKNIAQADETGSILSLTLVESLYDSAFTGNGAEYTYAMLVGACRKEPDRTIRLLVRMLQDKRLIGQASSVILNEINNLKEDSSGPDFFREFMDTIMSFAPTNAALVQQIEDWAEGRTLEILDKRVDAVEARIDELNQRVQESCQNFEEVMLYMDEHIEDLKEFVATVVKKLPSPIRLTVVGGLKKTIKLHFPCCRQHPPCQSPYGSEFTVETREWNKWLKIGFNVAKLGKCVIDIGLGNPLGLARTGIDAVSDIYEAYKKEDDEEFNNYITNPFLSNKEQDKLLEQLRGEAFFDAFEYDAQLAGWYCGLCASIPGQAVKMIEMEEEGLTGYGSTTKEKGEGRFGLNLTLEDGFKLGEKIVELVTGDEEEDGGGDDGEEGDDGDEGEGDDDEEEDPIELAVDAYDLGGEILEDRQNAATSDNVASTQHNEVEEEQEWEVTVLVDDEDQKINNPETSKPEKRKASKGSKPAADSKPSSKPTSSTAVASLRAKDAKIRQLQRNVRQLEQKAYHPVGNTEILELKREMEDLRKRVTELESRQPVAKCCIIS